MVPPPWLITVKKKKTSKAKQLERVRQ